MTFRQALQILVHAAADHYRGAGVGIRTVPNDREREAVRRAVEKVWPKMYDHEMTEQDLRSLGL